MMTHAVRPGWTCVAWALEPDEESLSGIMFYYVVLIIIFGPRFLRYVLAIVITIGTWR